MILSAMLAIIADWLAEPVTDARGTRAINNACNSLWSSLVQADVTTYADSPPTDLDPVADLATALPYSTPACIEFIQYYAISLCSSPIYEQAQAEQWAARAEAKRQAAVDEVLALQRRYLGSYPVPTTMEYMAQLLLRWTQVDPGLDARYDAINAAIRKFWQGLIDVDITTYSSSVPATLSAPADVIPFTEADAIAFIHYYALSLCFDAVGKPEQAKTYEAKAEARRQAAIEEIRQLKRAPSGAYAEPDTLGGMSTLILRWVKTDPGEDVRYDAVNNAVKSLWAALIQADIGAYGSTAPAYLTSTLDSIPFSDAEQALEYIQYYALSLCCQAVNRLEEAKAWTDRAAAKLKDAVDEILQLHRVPGASYEAPSTLGKMATLILRWLRQDPGLDVRYDAVNAAVKALWSAMIQVDIGTYGLIPPADLTTGTDALPFASTESALEFVQYHALSLCCQALGRPEEAKQWTVRAESEIASVKEDLLQLQRVAEAQAPTNSLAAMRASIRRWVRTDIGANLFNDAINDAIESLWESLMLVALSNFMAGPLTVSFASAAERASLTSVTDPTAAPTAADTPGGTLGARNYSITYTLVTESGSETLESPELAYAAGANQLTRVASPAFAEGAYGWNCYIGSVSGRRALQNSAPIPFGTSYTEPTTGAVDEPGKPSPPTVNTTGDDIFYIRELEMPLTDGGYRRWEQADLASELVKRASRAIASSSEYQSYYWDLLNQRTIELRPAAGMDAVPRYFYVKKPRRLRFDNAVLPFATLPATAFIRNYAISLLQLAPPADLKSSGAYAQKAEAERMRCQQAVLMQSRGKNQRITPYLM